MRLFVRLFLLSLFLLSSLNAQTMELMTITGVPSFDYFFSIFAFLMLFLIVIFAAAAVLDM